MLISFITVASTIYSKLNEEVLIKNNFYTVEETLINQEKEFRDGIKNKNGVYTTKPDEEFADKMKSIRIHGSGSNKYENIRLGINGRIDTIQAAIILEKLSIFDEELKLRNLVAEYYSKNISSNFKKPYIPKNYMSSWAQYSLLSQSEYERNKIMSILSSEGIPSMIYYKTPLHMQSVFKNLGYYQ